MSQKTVKLDVLERPPHIEQMAGANKGRTFDLVLEIMSIGRAPDNDIVFPSESVSRCHAFLKKTPTGWLLQDNQSKNGIKKNGEKVIEATLQNGDVVQVGEFVFRFVDPDEGTARPTKAAPRTTTTTRGGKARTASVVTQPGSGKVAARPVAKSQLASTGSMPVQPAPVPLEPVYADTNTAKKIGNFLSSTGGIITVVILSVLIGLKLRLPLARFHGGKKAVEAPSSPATEAKELPIPMAPSRSSGKTTKDVPVDQNNPNEGRIVDEKIVDIPPQAEEPPANSAPPPPIPESLTRKDLQIHPKKPISRTVKKDLGVYLQEGRDYLKEGDFESAALAFRFALVIDPNNRTAIEGIRASEFRKREIPQEAIDAPQPARNPRNEVHALLNGARDALAKRSYQLAIDSAEKARRIEIRGETAYLNEAKQIIDRARLKQKEDFDPFLERAQAKIRSGDYLGARQLCEEMLRTDPAYSDAKECVGQANEGLKGKK